MPFMPFTRRIFPFLSVLLAASAAHTSTAATFSNPSVININDFQPASPYPAQIAVSGVFGVITDVNVTLNGFGHDGPGDVDMILVGPQGQKVVVMAHAGGLNEVRDLSLVFDDEAAAKLSENYVENGTFTGPITSGTYKPSDYHYNNVNVSESFPSPAPARPYSSSLSAFDKTNPNGTWKLYVRDYAVGLRGFIQNGYTLNFSLGDPTGAAGLVVTTAADTVADDGVTSLREAISRANSDGVNSAITFDETVFAGPRKTLTLGSELPTLAANGTLSITAPSAGVEINGNSVTRVFSVADTANVTMRGLTIRGGNAPGNNGGGIANLGTLLVDACTLSGNRAARGGAIFSNTDLSGASFTLRNCTLSGNTATSSGGGLYNSDGLSIIESSTIAGNSAPAGQGSGVASFGDTLTRTDVGNSIIAGNTASDVDFVGGGANSFRSNTFNLIGAGNGTSNFNAAGDVTGNTNPGLSALAENGGPTQTRALVATSPAFNRGSTTLGVDQRGIARPQGRASDKGAFELVELPVPVATSGAIISEFRVGGPGGVSDEFIELYNQTNAPLNLSGWLVNSGIYTLNLPANLSAVPAYGRLLITGGQYSLKDYGGTDAALGDVSYSGIDLLAPGSTLGLYNPSSVLIDSVNAGSLPAPTSASSNYSYVRRMDGAGGAPQAGGAFNTVDVASTVGPNNTTGVSSNITRLGAPGPQNLSSPIAVNQLIKFTQTGVTRSAANNNVLLVRATVQNLSSRALTALRFRTVGITAGTAATNTSAADIRLTSSTSSDGVNLPLSLQNPPNQPNGGGLNASVSLSGLPSGGLAAGATVTVEFAFTIVKSGTFRYLLNLEPVTENP